MKRSAPLPAASLIKSLGEDKGNLAYNILVQEFNSALTYDDDTGYIECVATSPKARIQGVSTALCKHVMQQFPYRRYVLEVTDTNEHAFRLYRKLGFEVFERIKEENSAQLGYNERIYMQWRKSGDESPTNY